jgi:hypothetical protein
MMVQFFDIAATWLVASMPLCGSLRLEHSDLCRIIAHGIQAEIDLYSGNNMT